tara:strand:- start:498 stop:1295 length:798 start_codon:yes stop_codon:yes gene_type:complete
MKGIINLIWFFISWFVLFLISIGTGIILENSFLGICIFLIFLGTYYYLVFRNSEIRVKKAFSKLNDILMQDEAIIEKGIDKRPFALISRRQVFAVTNSRIIRLERPRLGGFEMKDFQWKDLEDATVSENVLSSFCGSTLYFKANNNEIRLGSSEVCMEFTVFPEFETASKAYKFAQQAEQSWEEKRRIRSMEEKRAEAGGIMIGQNTAPAISTAMVSKEKQDSNQIIDVTEELLKLKKLLDEGILSDAEFQEMKSKILARATQNF